MSSPTSEPRREGGRRPGGPAQGPGRRAARRPQQRQEEQPAQTAAQLPAHGARSVASRRLWFGVLAGPLGWVLVLLVADVAVEYACVTHSAMTPVLGLPLISLLVFLLAVVAGIVMLVAGTEALRDWRELRRGEAAAPGARPGRAEFMALAGVLLSALFVIAMIFQATTALVLPPCAMFRV